MTAGRPQLERRLEADLADMDCIVAASAAQEHGRGHREHLIDEEGGHASSPVPTEEIQKHLLAQDAVLAGLVAAARG